MDPPVPAGHPLPRLALLGVVVVDAALAAVVVGVGAALAQQRLRGELGLVRQGRVQSVEDGDSLDEALGLCVLSLGQQPA